MKKTLMFLLLTAVAGLAGPARADDAVLKYHVVSNVSITTISPNQVSVKRVMMDLARADTDRDMTVTLLPDRFGVRTGDLESVYDLSAKMLYKIDHARKTWQEISLHAIPLDRQHMRTAMAKRAIEFETATGTGKYTKTMSGIVLETKEHDLDLDTLYGSIGEMKTADVLKLVHRGPHKSFENQRGALVEFTQSEKLMPQSLVKSYNSFLAYIPSLHPDVEKAMSVSSKPFAVLKYKTDDHCGRRMNEEWELQGVAVNKGAALDPRPAGYTPYFTADAALNQSFVSAQGPGPKAANYADRIKGYIGQGDRMRAMLSQTEMSMSLTAEEARTQESLSFGVLGLPEDPLTRDTMTAIAHAQTQRVNIERANETLKKAKKAYPDYVYFLDVFRADNIMATRALDAAAHQPLDDKSFGKALKMYANALIENPWMATVYASLGDAHREYGDGMFAWLCWNTALKLKPDLPLKAKLDKIKASVEKDFPEYF